MNHVFKGGDSIYRKVTGFFKLLTADSISLDMVEVREKVLYNASDPQRRGKVTRETHFGLDEQIRFHIHDVDKMVTVNHPLENTMKTIFLTSLASGLVVSPLASIEKGKLNWSRVGTISGISAAVACLSITISLTCWDRHHLLKPANKKSKIWRIRT